MKANMIKASDRRIAFLRNWRAERLMERSISEASGTDDAEGYPIPVKKRVTDFDSDVKVGDVRLLADEHTSHYSGPRYVLVLEDAGNDCVICAPFSRYQYPATKDEWLTGVKSKTLQVLQLWNAQPSPKGAIAKTWYVFSFSDEKLARARILYKHSVLGTWPDEREDIGIQVTSKFDERNEYMNEERQCFSPLFSKIQVKRESERRKKMAKWPVGFEPIAVFCRESDYSLAAADAARIVAVDCSVDGVGGIVRVGYDPAQNTLRLRSFDATGKRSPIFDGWGVVGSKTEALGYFSGDSCIATVASDFDLRVALLDLNGGLHPLTAKEK